MQVIDSNIFLKNFFRQIFDFIGLSSFLKTKATIRETLEAILRAETALDKNAVNSFYVKIL
jgi:hypothetical protein